MTHSEPRQEHLAFDLKYTLDAIVGIKTTIPDDGFTAPILGTERSGSGVVISEDGLVLTIGYLVTEAESVWITDNRGGAVAGTVLGYDQQSGFGLIQPLGRLNLPHLSLGLSAAVRAGDNLIVAGAGGISSAINVQVTDVREFAGYWEYLLDRAIFTAPDHPNWGGTALLGHHGELLGIGSLFIQQSDEMDQAVDGNMIVPIDLLKPILSDLRTTGARAGHSRPWLGAFCADIDGHLVVANLAEGGPTDLAEMEIGDIILAVAGQPVDDLADLFRTVWSVGPAGVEIPITVSRDGERLDLLLETISRGSLLKKPSFH